MAERSVYKIIFQNQNKFYEMYAKHIYQSDLHGFIEMEECIFNPRSSSVVDPAVEKLKSEFEGVKRSYIPMHMIVRIDEVEKSGAGNILSIDGNGKKTLWVSPPQPIGASPTDAD